MLTVIARYRAQPGEGDAVAAALARHEAATRTEQGCVRFIAYRSREEPDNFVLYEQYIDESAFEAHRRSDHFSRYVEGTIVPLLTERQFSRYDEVPPEAE